MIVINLTLLYFQKQSFTTIIGNGWLHSTILSNQKMVCRACQGNYSHIFVFINICWGVSHTFQAVSNDTSNDFGLQTTFMWTVLMITLVEILQRKDPKEIGGKKEKDKDSETDTQKRETTKKEEKKRQVGRNRDTNMEREITRSHQMYNKRI